MNIFDVFIITLHNFKMTRQPVIRYAKRSRQYHCSNKGHIIHSIAVIIDYGRSSSFIVAAAAAAAAAAVYIVIC